MQFSGYIQEDYVATRDPVLFITGDVAQLNKRWSNTKQVIESYTERLGFSPTSASPRGSSQEWLEAIDTQIELERAPSDRKRSRAVALLQLHVVHCSLLAAKGSQPNRHLDTGFFDSEQARREHRRMLDLAAEALSLRPEDDADTSNGPTFCLDLGILLPIWFVVRRCRDPLLRRRAISILRSANCQDSLWSSKVCALVGENLMLLEERLAGGTVKTAEDIPACARVQDMKIGLRPGTQKVGLTFWVDDIGYDETCSMD